MISKFITLIKPLYAGLLTQGVGRNGVTTQQVAHAAQDATDTMFDTLGNAIKNTVAEKPGLQIKQIPVKDGWGYSSDFRAFTLFDHTGEQPFEAGQHFLLKTRPEGDTRVLEKFIFLETIKQPHRNAESVWHVNTGGEQASDQKSLQKLMEQFDDGIEVVPDRTSQGTVALDVTVKHPKVGYTEEPYKLEFAIKPQADKSASSNIESTLESGRHTLNSLFDYLKQVDAQTASSQGKNGGDFHQFKSLVV